MGHMRTRARELAATVVVSKTTTYGYRVIDAVPSVGVEKKVAAHCIGPQAKKLSQLYEQFRLIRMVVHWESMVGTTTPGSVILAAAPKDERPEGKQPTPSAAVCAAYQPNKTGRIYENISLAVPDSFLRAKAWWPIVDKTNETALTSLTCPAQVVVWIDTNSSSTEDQTVGRVWVEYEIEFQGFAVND